MSDKTPEAQLGKHISAKTTGGKDARLTKKNKNVTQQLPDRAKEQAEEKDILTRMAEADTRREGGNKKYGVDTLAVLIALRRDGKTWEKIAKMGHIGTIKLPSYDSLNYIKEHNPAFAEEGRFARKDHERDIVEGSIESIPLVGKHALRMRGMNRINGLATHARLGMQLGRQALPPDYGGDQEGVQEVMIFAPYGEWDPTRIVKGAPGQGVEGDAAAERWRKLREEGKDA